MALFWGRSRARKYRFKKKVVNDEDLVSAVCGTDQ